MGKVSWLSYASNPRLNFSSLKLLLQSARKYDQNRRCGEPPSDSDDMRLGRCIHTAILEPDEFERLPVWRGGVRRGNAWTDFKAEHGIDTGRDYLRVNTDEPKKCELTKALQVQMAVRNHPAAGPYLDREGEAERTVFWTHRSGAECKSRIDYLTADVIVDIKTTTDATKSAFARSAAKYAYWMQAAFYQDAVYSVTGRRLPFVWIALEKTEPYDLAVYRADEEDIAIGRFDYERLLGELAALDGEYWPGINRDQEVVLRAPPWAFESSELDVVMGDVA